AAELAGPLAEVAGGADWRARGDGGAAAAELLLAAQRARGLPGPARAVGPLFRRPDPSAGAAVAASPRAGGARPVPAPPPAGAGAGLGGPGGGGGGRAGPGGAGGRPRGGLRGLAGLIWGAGRARGQGGWARRAGGGGWHCLSTRSRRRAASGAHAGPARTRWR